MQAYLKGIKVVKGTNRDILHERVLVPFAWKGRRPEELSPFFSQEQHELFSQLLLWPRSP
jgi:ABC-type sulfate transport system substrate-binding protein